MAVNKVVYGNNVLVDLTNDTVSPENLQSGATAHDKSGGLIRGTANMGGAAPCTVMLAPSFSTSTSYSVGDYCIYNGGLYRFITEHTAGEWNNSHAIQITMSEDAEYMKLNLESLSNMESGQKTIENISGGNHYFLFNAPPLPGQKIYFHISMTNYGRFYTYKMLSKDGSERTNVVGESSESSWSYVVPENEVIYGVMVWIRDPKGGSLSYDYTITNKYETFVEDSITYSTRASVDIYDSKAVSPNGSYTYYFDRPLKNGQKLFVASGCGQDSLMNIYKILEKDNPNNSEVFASYVHNYNNEIISTDEKPIWGVHVWFSPGSSSSDQYTMHLQAKSYDDSINEFEDTKKSLTDDISLHYKHTISQDVNNYFYYLPYKLFPGQELFINVEITGGAFYFYKLYDVNDISQREVFPEAVSVTRFYHHIVGNDSDRPVVGFMAWINDKSIGSVFSVNIDCEDVISSCDKMIPNTQIEPVLANLNWNKDAYNNIFEFKPFVSVHFSDIHGDVDALSRLISFRKKYSKYLDAVIHTGDATATCWESGYSDLWNKSDANILQVIGNHDAWTNGTSGCKAWTTGYSATQCYQRYIDPIKSLIQSVPNKCYWVKRFSESKIMLIAIDNWHWREEIRNTSDVVISQYPNGDSVDTGEQYSWFVDRLTDAKEEGYGVVVLSHIPAGIITKPCTYTSLMNWPMGGIPLEAVTAVQDFIDGGGEFITWLCGHTHYDMFGELTSYQDQTLITIDSGRAADRNAARENWEDNSRVLGTRSENLFNIFSVDRNKKFITLFRVGMDYDKFGRRIGSLVYDYANKNIIWNG